LDHIRTYFSLLEAWEAGDLGAFDGTIFDEMEAAA
jgi:hypothetical protein